MTLSPAGKPPLLRASSQPAIAAGENEHQTAAELELISVLSGPAFRGSSRSSVFLRFVVEETLAGRHDLLKERTIGIQVLGKSLTYDTGADSGVRVRANDVRKRLAAHYDSVPPKAGIRIELPPGTYIPRFSAAPAAVTPKSGSATIDPPPMQNWQLAAPCLLAVFLALLSIRGGMDASDSYSRFWNHELAGRTAISIAVDADGPYSISPAVADAALPLESLATAYQLPVHVVPAGFTEPSVQSCVIRLSTRQKPVQPVLLRLNGATVFRGSGNIALWLWADTPEKLRAAAQTLASQSGFPAGEFGGS